MIKTGPKLTLGLRVFYVLCALLVGLDLVYHRHVERDFESLWGFYAIYGFISCVVLVLIAKEMRKLLMRAEDYYEPLDNSDGSETPTQQDKNR